MEMGWHRVRQEPEPMQGKARSARLGMGLELTARPVGLLCNGSLTPATPALALLSEDV